MMTAMKDTSMNTNLHAAFLREIARLRKATTAIDLSDAAARDGLARRYAFFSAALHHHHEGEDSYLWEKVRPSATPAEITILDEMESEHGALAAALEPLDQQFATLSADADAAAIAAQFDALVAVLEPHCAHEEAEGIQIVQKYLSADDMKAFMEFNRNAANASLVLPWVCDGASAEVSAQTWGVMPTPVRMMVKPMLTRKYAKFTKECGV